MSIKSFTPKAILFSALIAPFLTTLQPSSAQASGRYYCGESQGDPTTIFEGDGLTLHVIRWRSGYFTQSGWTPEKRCTQVSRKFDMNLKNKNLSYIVPGRAPNGLPVLCASPSPDNGIKSCDDTSILITLESSKDYNKGVNALESLNDGRSENAVVFSPVLLKRKDGYYIISVSKMVDRTERRGRMWRRY